ncbi:hypothetical protein HAX54_024546 [Datura stramonium]|uniref:Uncharacterized protein n=1 Tax=Datura stramonium TaxID=4076 RepID=A0ABS8S5M7_DATST|nr:hypothetical protein [Datura stramonium]
MGWVEGSGVEPSSTPSTEKGSPTCLSSPKWNGTPIQAVAANTPSPTPIEDDVPLNLDARASRIGEVSRLGHLFELPIPYMYDNKVTEFYERLMCTDNEGIVFATMEGEEFFLDATSLRQILRVPTDGISIFNCYYLRFLYHGDPGYVSAINLLMLMIEHIFKVTNIKDGRHALRYEYLLMSVFKHFGVVLGKGTVATKK